MRDSVVFYRSFFEAIEDLPAEDFKQAVMGFLSYALDDVEPEVSGAAKTFFKMAKPLIDTNNKKYQNGKKGGRSKTKQEANENQDETKTEPNKNQTETKAEPNNEDVDVDENENVKNNKNILADARGLFERLWKLYPCKKGKGQVSDTQKKRLLAIGEPALVKAIERYSTELQKDADWRKAQNGSTFFNSGYVDYLDENYVPGEERRKTKDFNNFERRKYDMAELERKVSGLREEVET